MLARTKTHLTKNGLVPLRFLVHPSNVERVTRYVNSIESNQENGSRPWRDVIKELRPGEPVSAGVLRGARGTAELTQVRLSEKTGIPQRHISEMERGKRPIGKETARKLAAALKTDYRVFL